jgi:3D (Asp-Asp-Asp) domain-containing protein
MKTFLKSFQIHMGGPSRLFAIALASFLWLPPIADACRSGVAATTTYFLPHVDNYCADGQACSAFKKEVKMQGSGRLRDNRVLRYNGRTSNMSDCPTTTGAAGRCLIPYISIAADPKYHRLGSIIEMPELRGKWITLEDGREFQHPGYFRVDDTGGSIKGRGRFDIFTGFRPARHSRNPFGYQGEWQMSAKSTCASYKTYNVINRRDARFTAANEAIERAMQIPMASGSTTPATRQTRTAQ